MSHCNLTPSVFTFAPGLDLRVVHRAGTPWFPAADVCGVLTIANPRQALAGLEDDEKGVQIVDTLGGPQRLNVVSESGLYALILKSRKPEAQKFRKWVTAVVLPALRKDGAYVAGEEKVVSGEMSEDELIARAFTALHTKAQRLAAENLMLAQKVTEQAPAVEFHETYVAAQQTQTLRGAAKGLGIGPRVLMDLLKRDRVLFQSSSGGPVEPRQEHINAGRFVFKQAVDSYGRSQPQTRVTPKGFDWLSKKYGGFAGTSSAARTRSL